MSDAFSKIIAILLSVVMMFIIPVFYMQEEADRLKQTYAIETITAFVDGVRNTGILSNEDYNEMEQSLLQVCQMYTVELTHSMHTLDKDGEGVSFFTDEYYTKQIKDVLESGKNYLLSKHDYLKAVVKDEEDNVIAWYGGSVRYEAY